MMFLPFVKHGIIATSLYIFFLLYWPNLVDIEPVAYSPKLPKEYSGPLKQNVKLSEAEHLFEGEIKGAESLAEYKGSIYTGLVDGRVVKITGNKIQPVARFGKLCDGPWDEPICGRPLGLKVVNDTLYVIDAYYGLFTINLKTEVVKSVLPAGDVIDGKPLMFPNDLAVDDDGNVYITESSNKWILQRIVFSVLEHENTGRLIKYNPKTKEATVLADNLYMPNGIEMAHDKQSLLFSETTKFQITRYYIKGPKQGTSDVFTSELPGEPDNIRKSKDGGYWIALVTGRTELHPSILDRLAQYPLLRKIHAKTMDLVGSVLKYLATHWPNEHLKLMAHEVHSGHFMYRLIPLRGMILKVNSKGEWVDSLQSADGKCAFVSEVLEKDGYLYLGSFRNPYIGRIKI